MNTPFQFLMKLKQYEEESARTRRHLVETASKRVSDLIGHTNKAKANQSMSISALNCRQLIV